MNDRVIVSYSWSELKKHLSDFDSNTTVWCYDFEGNILWYIEKLYYIDEHNGKKITYDQPLWGSVVISKQVNYLLIADVVMNLTIYW